MTYKIKHPKIAFLFTDLVSQPYNNAATIQTIILIIRLL